MDADRVIVPHLRRAMVAPLVTAVCTAVERRRRGLSSCERGTTAVALRATGAASRGREQRPYGPGREQLVCKSLEEVNSLTTSTPFSAR